MRQLYSNLKMNGIIIIICLEYPGAGRAIIMRCSDILYSANFLRHKIFTDRAQGTFLQNRFSDS